MMTISPKQRFLWGSALIGVSVVFFMVSIVWKTVTPMGVGELGESATSVTLEQYSSNLIASTTPILSGPTQTNIFVSFPEKMTVNETLVVSVKVEWFTIVYDLLSSGSSDEIKFEEKLDPVQSLDQDVMVRLLSSGFDIQGLSTAKFGTHFPLSFTWTITPKKEGMHELLLDLSEVIRDARTDSEIDGMTDVRLRDKKISLKDGTFLPLQIKVGGRFGVPTWVLPAGSSLPGVLGFLLTFPLIMDWLKRRRKQKPSKRLKAPSVRMVVAPSDILS